MLDYKDIITKHYTLGMRGMAIAQLLEVSISNVNGFLRAFKECMTLSYDYLLSVGTSKLECDDPERQGCEAGAPALHRSN